MADAADLVGTWLMLSWTREVVASGCISDAMGPDPVGYIACHADGRMMATVFQRDRPAARTEPCTTPEKSVLFDGMPACVARYSIDGDWVVHHVERAWNPNWEIDLTRPFLLGDGQLTISGAPGTDPVTGRIWRWPTKASPTGILRLKAPTSRSLTSTCRVCVDSRSRGRCASLGGQRSVSETGTAMTGHARFPS